MGSINLTSFMDMTFNLLIAFMLIAPTLKHGMELDLPEVKATNLKPKDSITVVVRKAPERGEEERIYIDDKRVTISDLTVQIKAMYERKKNLDVLIEADKTVPYEIVAKVLNAVQKAGVTGVGLVTEPAVEK
ncbi:MAG TPA: biopolymer transporter ExbD [Candidatus Sumerlaeota bacterium]|jgi:biopolymer transport protein TolR|nr:biopolymer transporter ExbD [Candidatus Sumerlaeota bacterium]HRR30942.1 biopolymer transporter ExbD [Candidatus Sumerlaeia bacterium]HON49362.1 biopolymer transporter ExbD [Candidatus Sumerlaeota bacterium]HOR64890.1 biopolymer transporter ExbD [Candidatus Sumerlaeota bacterium]HQH12395.1 biopolymer transporter ExbD [Candidatus Sumerlaeota bacterium]